MTDERRARLEELAAQQKYVHALAPASAQLTELLGFPVGGGDAVTREAVRAALDAAQEQERYHLVWHRVWGVRLRDEVIETTARLADLLQDERAVLVWGRRPQVGFLVPVAAALRALPPHLGPEPGEVGPGGVGLDMLLVGEGGKSGLLLAYDHYANSDEYQLRSWGSYARSVGAAP